MDKTQEIEIPLKEQTDATLMQFVRDRKGQPRGIVVAKKVNGTVRIGWSFTNKKAGDSFNKKRGIEIATGRIYNLTNRYVPTSVVKVVNGLIDRSKKYFRVDDVYLNGQLIDDDVQTLTGVISEHRHDETLSIQDAAQEFRSFLQK